MLINNQSLIFRRNPGKDLDFLMKKLTIVLDEVIINGVELIEVSIVAEIFDKILSFFYFILYSGQLYDLDAVF